MNNSNKSNIKPINNSNVELILNLHQHENLFIYLFIYL